MKPSQSTKPTPWRLLGLGLELGMLIGGLTYLGHLADERFDTGPWLALAGAIMAMVGGCYTLARQVLAMNGNKDRRQR